MTFFIWKRSETIMKGSRNFVRLETFESERKLEKGSSNALEQIVEDIHVHASKTKESL